MTSEEGAMALAPAGVPLLGRGRHRDPADGACLMEATALFAGEQHTDHPDSVHPVLAALARLVNDAVSDVARAGLLRQAPRLVGTAAAGPDINAALVELCCRDAQAVTLPIWAARVRRDLRRAQAGKSFTLKRAVRTVTVAAGSLALATLEDRDAVLLSLLAETIDLASEAVRPQIPTAGELHTGASSPASERSTHA
jgi:hypothetical protein